MSTANSTKWGERCSQEVFPILFLIPGVWRGEKKKVIMIDNQNKTRLPHLKKNGERAIPGSLCPPVNPVVPAGVVSLLLHDTLMAAVAPHGVEWQHALLFNLYDLHMTRRAQRPQCCLSDGRSGSQSAGFLQQVLSGPLILSEM